jgi:hypothetical protein
MYLGRIVDAGAATDSLNLGVTERFAIVLP